MDIEGEILKIIKRNKNIWVSQIYRELIKQGIPITYPRLMSIINGMVIKNIVSFEFVGRNKVIKLGKDKKENEG